MNIWKCYKLIKSVKPVILLNFPKDKRIDQALHIGRMIYTLNGISGSHHTDCFASVFINKLSYRALKVLLFLLLKKALTIPGDT